MLRKPSNSMKRDSKRGKVTLISRESNNKTLDFRLLEEELMRRGIEVEVLTRLLEKKLSLKSAAYLGHMVRQMKAISDSSVVVLDTYCIPVSMFGHNRDTTVIQMWHALSAIKKFGWQTVGKADGSSEKVARIMRMHEGYDKVLCASDVTARSFCEAFRVSEDKIVKLGLPRIDYILKEDPAIEHRIKNQYMDLGNKEVILYAPTFHKGRPADVRGLAEALDLEKYALLVRLHPLDSTSPEDHVKIPGVVYEPYYDTYDLLRVADYVISDYSSFVVEASLTGKPLYLYTYDIDEYRNTTGLNVNFAEEAIGKYLFKDAAALAAELENEPYDYDALAEFSHKYVDIDTHNCTERLADYIETLI